MRVRIPLLLVAALLAQTPAGTGAARAEGARPLWQIPLDGLSASRDRPLMSPTRRPKPPPPPPAPPPPPPVIAAAPPPPPEPIRATLLGVLLGGESSLAILRDEGDQSVKRVRVGEDLAGWTLTAVRRREVDFRRGEKETVTLPLPPPGPTSASANSPRVPQASPGMAPYFQPPRPSPNPVIPTPMPMPMPGPGQPGGPNGQIPGMPPPGTYPQPTPGRVPGAPPFPTGSLPATPNADPFVASARQPGVPAPFPMPTRTP